MNSVGVDIHKTRCIACIKNPEGTMQEEFTFQNNPEGLEELVKHLKAYPEVQVAIESTGNLWTTIYDRLEAEQIHVILTNPKKTKAIAEAKIKTDRLNARMLADLLRGNQLKAPCTDLFGKHGLAWLNQQQLQPGDRTLLEVNLEQLNSLNHSINRLTEDIASSAIENPEVKLLMGFTGIDYYSAMLLINEIGPITRFPSPKNLVSYAGLAPSTHQSGNRTFHGSITKEGNSHIRWILIEAAQHASRHDPRFNQFYQRITKRRGHQKAIVAVARKMLVTIYHVLNHRNDYRGLRPELYENKIKRLQRITKPSLQVP